MQEFKKRRKATSEEVGVMACDKQVAKFQDYLGI